LHSTQETTVNPTFLERAIKRTLLCTALGLAALGGALTQTADGATGTTATAAKAAATLTVRSTRYGTILFDGRGRALYGFTRDKRGGPSQCYGACATAWPVQYAKAGQLRAGAGVKQSLIGTTRRRDGRLQVTYNGWPLYYYVDDVRPGQVTCQNVDEFGGLWLVVRPSGQLVR
jgi:predicted lipoprotein with Yx(FWY)xxD motif